MVIVVLLFNTNTRPEKKKNQKDHISFFLILNYILLLPFFFFFLFGRKIYDIRTLRSQPHLSTNVSIYSFSFLFSNRELGDAKMKIKEKKHIFFLYEV